MDIYHPFKDSYTVLDESYFFCYLYMIGGVQQDAEP